MRKSASEGRSAERIIAELEALFRALPRPEEGPASFREAIRGVARDLLMTRPDFRQKTGLTAKAAKAGL